MSEECHHMTPAKTRSTPPHCGSAMEAATNGRMSGEGKAPRSLSALTNTSLSPLIHTLALYTKSGKNREALDEMQEPRPKEGLTFLRGFHNKI